VRSLIVGALASLLTIACAAPETQGDTALLTFIADGETTRTEAVLHLGQPSASFENDRILTWRLHGDDQAGYFISDDPGTWNEVRYSLVLVFGSDGVLETHSKVAVK
jgi:hypothetical protein